jgi:lipopolysaccharide biosynthesis glycosyltransferase
MDTWCKLALHYDYDPSFYTRNVITVILALNRRHFPGMIPLIKSLDANTLPSLEFKIFQLDLLPEEKQAIIRAHKNVTFYDIVNKKSTRPYAWWFEAFDYNFIRMSKYTLYIDVDIIVNRPLHSWLEKFDESATMVSGVAQKTAHADYRERSANHLINTGVVLFKHSFFDTKYFENLQSAIHKVGIANIKNDQLFLRKFFNNEMIEVLYAPYSFNANAYLLKHFNDKPHIYHFVGTPKPWHHLSFKRSHLWTRLVKEVCEN